MKTLVMQRIGTSSSSSIPGRVQHRQWFTRHDAAHRNQNIARRILRLYTCKFQDQKAINHLDLERCTHSWPRALKSAALSTAMVGMVTVGTQESCPQQCREVCSYHPRQADPKTSEKDVLVCGIPELDAQVHTAEEVCYSIPYDK